MSVNVSTGMELLDAVCKAARIDSRLVHRVVIDIPCDDLVWLYVEMVGSEELLEVDWGAEEINVKIVGGEAQDG